MGQHHRIKRPQRRGQRLPVAQAQLLETLEEPAVDQYPRAVTGQQEFAAGHGAGAAKKCQLHGQGSQLSAIWG